MGGKARPAANPNEVLEGISVRHEAYGRKMPLLEYQAGRLASRFEHRAEPWVLDRGDGTIVATLLLRRFDLALDGDRFPAFGIGSLGTRLAHRRQGHAAALCEAVRTACEAEGRRVGLLYSAIPPAYYERLGYRTAPAHGWRCDRPEDLAESGEAAPLTPIDPRRDAARLRAAFVAAHRGVLHVRRDVEGFLGSLDDAHDEWFLGVRGGAGGYVRVEAEDDGTLMVLESAVPDPDDEPAALRAVARLAAEAGRKTVAGWMEPSAFVREWFAPASRDRNLPMLRGAPPAGAMRFHVTDHF